MTSSSPSLRPCQRQRAWRGKPWLSLVGSSTFWTDLQLGGPPATSRLFTPRATCFLLCSSCPRFPAAVEAKASEEGGHDALELSLVLEQWQFHEMDFEEGAGTCSPHGGGGGREKHHPNPRPWRAHDLWAGTTSKSWLAGFRFQANRRPMHLECLGPVPANEGYLLSPRTGGVSLDVWMLKPTGNKPPGGAASHAAHCPLHHGGMECKRNQ